MVAAMLCWLAIAVALGLGISRFFLGYPVAPVGARTLTAREFATVRAAANVIYPAGGGIPASGDSARVGLHVDQFVRAQTSGNRLLMRLLFVAIEHATLVFPPHGSRRWRRFSALDPAQQLAYLDGWRLSEVAPRRVVFMSLRAILTMGYFADAGVLRALGLAPREIEPPVIEADLLWPRVGEHPQDIRFSAGDVAPVAAPALGPLTDGTPLHPEFR